MEADGQPIRVRGTADLTPEDTAALGEIVAAAKRLHAAEHPEQPAERPTARCHRTQPHPHHLYLRNRQSIHCPGVDRGQE